MSLTKICVFPTRKMRFLVNFQRFFRHDLRLFSELRQNFCNIRKLLPRTWKSAKVPLEIFQHILSFDYCLCLKNALKTYKNAGTAAPPPQLSYSGGREALWREGTQCVP